jgi:hypothetical protein
MIGHARIGLLCAVLAAGAAVTSAHAQTPVTAAEVSRLVTQAKQGDVVATTRLESWVGAVRAGDASALTVAADVINAGIVADADRVRQAERDAAAGGWDARTGFLRSVIDGSAHITTAQAATFTLRTAGLSAVDTASSFTQPTDLDGQVVLSDTPQPQIDQDDLVVDEIEADSELVASSTSPSKSACDAVNYYDELFNFTVMGLEICVTWKYDKARGVVSSTSRTITPYVTVWGTATGWHWVGTNYAKVNYYNYKRRGAKSGWHTRTIGHFQRCVVQVVVPYCDQDRLPTIVVDAHYDGTSSSLATP